MEKKHIAVDVGSSNCKIYIGQINKRNLLEMDEIRRFETPRVMYQNHLCINVYRIYEEMCMVFKKLAADGVEISSVGVDTWSSDFGLIDAAGVLQGLPVFYRDDRTKGVMEIIEEKMGYQELYYLTTQRKLQDTTLAQLIALKRENADALTGGKKLLFLGDLLMYMLSGVVVSEISVASYSQMYNMKERRWASEVFKRFEIPEAIQPDVIQAGTKIGKLQEKTARWCGVKPFDIIAPAVHDTSSAGVTVPADREHVAFIATGTWYLVSMEITQPENLDLCFSYNLSSTGLAFGKMLLKKNVMAMWLIQECKKIWEEKGIAADYPWIAAEAEKARPFAAVIDTEEVSFFAPDNMPQAIVSYLRKTGQGEFSENDVGQIARIIYESVAYKCRYALHALERVTNRKVDTLYVIGGASTIDIMNQYIADATGIEVIIGAKEASSAGNIMFQAYACKEVNSRAEIVSVVERTFPQKHYYPKEETVWAKNDEMIWKLCKLPPV